MTSTEIAALNLLPGPIVEIVGTGTHPKQVQLIGSRLKLDANISKQGAGWSARIDPSASRWGGAKLPPPSGSYLLKIDSNSAKLVGTHSPAETLFAGHSRIRFRVEETEVWVVFTAPLEDDEVGAENQSRLEAEYRANSTVTDSVFFESFYGRNASCNPLALDRELAKVKPETVRYWSVVDVSVQVPEGSIAVIEGSRQWWNARAEARLIVINDWLRNRFRPKSHQKVLQTWHGTMLKRLALSRKGLRVRPALATLRERSRWDALLAQNDYSKRIFRRSYAYFGPIWEEGYPRDDVLISGEPTDVRSKLGTRKGAQVLLYAPTWRDDRPEKVDHLDVADFSAKLGKDWVVLIRGHSRTITPGSDVESTGVIDVTTYPDVSELFLVADVLVTDYSSVMFDFTVTGKPIFFYTPDLKRYRGDLRGFYFDFLPAAPGPVVTDSIELARLVRDSLATKDTFAARYQEWQKRFNPHDDGKAAERVVARLIKERFI